MKYCGRRGKNGLTRAGVSRDYTMRRLPFLFRDHSYPPPPTHSMNGTLHKLESEKKLCDREFASDGDGATYYVVCACACVC